MANVKNQPLCSGVIAVLNGPKSHTLTVILAVLPPPPPQPRWRHQRHKPWEGLLPNWCRILMINNYCDIRFKGWSLSHEGFISFSWSRQSHKKWFTALLFPISFSAQWTPLVPHEVARIDGFYLSKMSQVDFPNDEQYARGEGPECSF